MEGQGHLRHTKWRTPESSFGRPNSQRLIQGHWLDKIKVTHVLHRRKSRSELNLMVTDAQVSDERSRTLGQRWKVKLDGQKVEGEGHQRWKVKDTMTWLKWHSMLAGKVTTGQGHTAVSWSSDTTSWKCSWSASNKLNVLGLQLTNWLANKCMDTDKNAQTWPAINSQHDLQTHTWTQTKTHTLGLQLTVKLICKHTWTQTKTHKLGLQLTVKLICKLTHGHRQKHTHLVCN